jgi:hypothetical protein
MADLKDRFGNFDGKSIGHQQCSADILAEEFQPTKGSLRNYRGT